MAAVGDLQENLLGDQQDDHQVERQAMFPLNKRVMIHVAQPVSMVAIATTCTALVLAAQGLDTKTTSKHALAVMGALIFAYLPFALFAVIIAVAVQENPALVGLSSGCLLGHLLLPTVIGGVVNYVKAGEDLTLVSIVSVLMLVGTILAWACLCTYPKFLHIRCCGGPIVPAENQENAVHPAQQNGANPPDANLEVDRDAIIAAGLGHLVFV